MSFKGSIEARCPKGCEPFTAEVWSFIRGDQSPELREVVLARECNLILCPSCDSPFFPEASYVYLEPEAELLAFVFPESYRDREAFWREKMSGDFESLKRALGGKLPLGVAPDVFFGPDGLAELLADQDYRDEEREVMEHYAAELGLDLYRVSPRFARERGMPSCLPVAARRGSAPTVSGLIRGLERLLEANDALAAYRDYLGRLKAVSNPSLPPPAAARPS